MYGKLLIAVLVVTGGAIAMIGDRVGSKVGKKKLSLFGLRPRHTSVIVTVVTGVLITTLTFAVLAAASENVRVALFGMEELNENMRWTQAHFDEAVEALARAREAQTAAGAALEKSRAEVEALEGVRDDLTARARSLARGNEQLEAAKAALTAQNEALSSGNARLAEENGALEKENQELAARTEALREGLYIMREGDIRFRAGEVLATGVLAGRRSADAVRADMGALIELANQGAVRRLGLEGEPNMIWIYTPEYDAAVSEIAASGEDMVVRIVAAGNLVRGEPVRTNLQVFPNRIVYTAGEFILARPFARVSSRGEAEAVAMRFLQDVNAAAKEKGILPDPIQGSVGVMENAQFFEIVNAMTALRGAGVLSAAAREKTGRVGPLRLRLRVEPDEAAAS